MIWQSPLLMGLIGSAIVLAALAVMVVFYRHRRAIRTLRLNVAVTWIVLGLSAMALHYAGDLAIMFVLPALTSPEVAMAAMTDLHLNWSWLASLIAAACIAFRLFGLLSRLLPGISDSMTEIQAELEARRAAEASLRISEARLRDITEASSDWFWEMDENLRFSYFSEGYGDIVGLSQQTLLGTTRQETDVPGVDPEIWEAHLADLAAHRSFRDFHITRARPDGSPVYLSVNGKPIFDEAGNFLG
jgi:PAS domain S-box-containing protein